jgi:hypothetical protein
MKNLVNNSPPGIDLDADFKGVCHLSTGSSPLAFGEQAVHIKS